MIKVNDYKAKPRGARKEKLYKRRIVFIDMLNDTNKMSCILLAEDNWYYYVKMPAGHETTITKSGRWMPKEVPSLF